MSCPGGRRWCAGGGGEKRGAGPFFGPVAIFFGPGRSPRVTMACLPRAASLGKTSWPNLLTDKEEMAGFFV